MLRSLRNSLQTHPKASRSGAEGSKGLGGQDRDTLLFLQSRACCPFVFVSVFSLLLPVILLAIDGFVMNSDRNYNSILYMLCSISQKIDCYCVFLLPVYWVYYVSCWQCCPLIQKCYINTHL